MRINEGFWAIARPQEQDVSSASADQSCQNFPWVQVMEDLRRKQEEQAAQLQDTEQTKDKNL